MKPVCDGAVNRLVDAVRAFALERGMFAPGDRVLVAVSGGADSVTLLHVLHGLRDELKITLYVAHLDHRLRGESSSKDAEFVGELASRLKIPCVIGAREVRDFVRRSRTSIEEGARIVRYEFLSEMALRFGASKIATGHTLDDQAETVIFRLLRGSGTKGLSGIPPVREGLFVRPLLRISREEIERFLLSLDQPFRRDASNQEIRFARNRIRQQVLPELKSYNPNLLHTLGRTAEILRAEDELLDELTAERMCEVVRARWGNRIVVLDACRLRNLPIALQRRTVRNVCALLSGGAFSPGFDAVEQVLCLLHKPSSVPSADPRRTGRYGQGQAGRFLRIPPGWTVERCRDLLILKRGPTPKIRRGFPVPGELRVPELGLLFFTRILQCAIRSGEHLGPPPGQALFDLDRLEGTLELRSRLPGDVFRPHGLQGHKKLGDLFTDRKIPRTLRDEIPLLIDARRILWVVGMRTSEASRITEATRRMLHVTCRTQDASGEEVLSSGFFGSSG